MKNLFLKRFHCSIRQNLKSTNPSELLPGVLCLENHWEDCLVRVQDIPDHWEEEGEYGKWRSRGKRRSMRKRRMESMVNGGTWEQGGEEIDEEEGEHEKWRRSMGKRRRKNMGNGGAWGDEEGEHGKWRSSMQRRRRESIGNGGAWERGEEEMEEEG